MLFSLAMAYVTSVKDESAFLDQVSRNVATESDWAFETCLNRLPGWRLFRY